MKKEKRVLTERQVERRANFIGWLKSLIFPAVLSAIILAGVFYVVNYQNVEEAEELIPLESYTGGEEPLVMENDELLFTMDPVTTQFTVKVKSTGAEWSSNPEGAADDSAALPEERGNLQSTLLMTYSMKTGLETNLDNWNYSIANGIYDIEQGEDYIRVNYSIGDVEKEYIIPPVITIDNFEKWTSKMEAKKADICSQYYKKYNIKKLSKKDNKEELLASYPILADTIIYVLRDTTKENVRREMQTYFEEAGYTYEDYVADKELDLSTTTSDKPIFNVDMIYKLDGGDLLVELPYSEMESVEKYPIYTVTPLPYFGAGGKQEEGFVLVPEGGGATIHFNNGKVNQGTYYANVYGWDMAHTRDAVVHNTRAYYGVYGISKKDASFICILEEGSPYASVQADISGKKHSFNYVNSLYSVYRREQYDVGDIANSEIFEYVPALPDESLIQRYRFVDSGSYSDMAKAYGDYLEEVYGDYMKPVEDTDTPVAIEIVGAVDKVKQIFGVPVSRPLKLTTYDEAGEIITDLTNDGVKNMSVKLTGWCNDGVKQNILTKVKPIRDLGNQKDINNLVATAKNAGVDLYLNGITQYEFNSNLFDGFISFRDAAKNISKERVDLYEYSHITYAERDELDKFYLLHTELAQDTADTIVNYVQKVGSGISYSDIGMDVSSDYYRKNTYSREAVKDLHETHLKETNDAGTNIMINTGNDYAIPFSKMVTNMDLRGNSYTLLDESVPFYQMAVHGRVNYTGQPINICGNTQDEVLYAAEYGAGLSFTFMKESAFALQKTLYTQYYGSDYDAWHDDMMAIYTRFNEELGHVYNQEMVDHVNYTPELCCTTYEDGTKVFVNYSYSEGVTPDGVTVPARDYLVIR
ncbi:MAG: hypothetical protein IKY23_13675 [Lachnospiraceae bacterium]|nr:hypothetical protein [Lachnospiraceae bacterium]